jgi:hypothetical protein
MDPFTGALILGGLNAGMGAMKANQAAKQRKMEADLRAAEMEASPWTGKGPSTQISTAAPSVWGEMAGGAVNALGQTAALQNAGLFKAGDVAAPAAGALDPNLTVGGQQTAFGAIGGQGLDEATKQGVDYFNKPLASNSWDQMIPKGMPGMMGRRP